MKKIFIILLIKLFWINISIAQYHIVVGEKIIIADIPSAEDVLYTIDGITYQKIPENQLQISEDKLFLVWSGYKFSHTDLLNIRFSIDIIDSRDSKIYKVVKIGKHGWMAENLAYEPNNGQYWAYDNDKSNVSKYGYLYDFETAKNVCPSGWHLPSDAEWTALTSYLGGEDVAGGKMKESSLMYWKSPNKGVSNESHYSALPGGMYHIRDGFILTGFTGIWWSSTLSNKNGAWYRSLHNERNNITRNSAAYNYGLSVRCIKD